MLEFQGIKIFLPSVIHEITGNVDTSDFALKQMLLRFRKKLMSLIKMMQQNYNYQVMCLSLKQ